MILPETNDEKLKLALDILVNGEKRKVSGWKSNFFELYFGPASHLLILLHKSSQQHIFLKPDKESPHFAPLVLLLKIKSPGSFEAWRDSAWDWELDREKWRP